MSTPKSTVQTQVPDAGTPIFSQEGYIHPVWHQFFYMLLRRTGGTAGVDAGSDSGRIDIVEGRVEDAEQIEQAVVSLYRKPPELPFDVSRPPVRIPIEDLQMVPSHGIQTDPALHALATQIASGFMAPGDKARIDALSATSSPTFAGVSLTNGQVQFPVTQVASANPNVLDDYAEGAWVPTLTFSTPGNVAVSYALREGFYTKIGRQVTLTFLVSTSAFTYSTANGGLIITGAPYPSSVHSQIVGTLSFVGLTKAGYSQFVPRLLAGSSDIGIVASGSGVGRYVVDTTTTASGTQVLLNGTITYFV